MANIVVAIFNPLIRQNGLYPYFETFFNVLNECGNNILCFQKIAAETSMDTEIPVEYLNKIQEFNPDLFILVNNQFWDISKHFDIPIIIYDVDSPNVYCNIDILKKNIDRYKYLCITKSGVDLIHEIIGCDYSAIKYIPPFTGVNNDKTTTPNLNIAFCGSHWLWNDFRQVENFLSLNPSDEERNYARQVYNSFLQYPFKTSKELYENLNIEAKNKLQFDNLYIWSARMSGLKRLRCLLEVADLGLEIRGYLWNSPNSTPLKAFPELLLSLSNIPVNSTLATQNFYNAAKIGFNTTHIQANTGFGWRVADILASNACLVTEHSQDLLDLGFDIPTYKTPTEARKLCLELLNDENYRQSIVNKCNNLINKNHRLENILPTIEDFIGLNLHSENKGSLEFVTIESSKKTPIKNIKLKIFDKFKLKVYKLLDEQLRKKKII